MSLPDIAASIVSGVPTGVPAVDGIVYEGWVLKKRRKKMQGFARRYFVLRATGVLHYSFEPGQPIRDQIALPHAVISTSPGRKDIHLDSNTATFHIKCLSTEDFNAWMTAFRKFIALGHEARQSLNLRQAPRSSTLNVNKTNPVVEDIATSIRQLEDAFQALQQEAQSKKHHSLNKSKGREHGKDAHGSVFSMFKKEKDKNGSHSEFGELTQEPTSTSYERVQLAIDLLKSHHSQLVQFIQSLESNTAGPIPEEEEPSPVKTRSAYRSSYATSGSDISEWFDAVDGLGDGPQELVLENDDSIGPEAERTSKIIHEVSDSGDDTDNEEEAQPKAEVDPSAVVRRTQLPSPPVGDEGSLFSMLKKNVGKDLSTISFPVTFNEPLTLLQRLAEEVEYYDLLSQAAATEDPTERFSFIAAFAVSSYAHTRHRSGRKGFNPMLAETFEDTRMKFISEKVSHQPLIMAYHAEGSGWDLTSTSAGKTKFWGKSLEIIPLGITRLRIGEEVFEWNKPSSFMRNLMMGTKYLEHVGSMTITNITDSSKCIIEFKQGGYWGASNAVSGTIHSSSGSVTGHLEGKWDESLAQQLDNSHLKILWRINSFPKNAHDYYGFTSFGITLNEITSDLEGKLPPTDSRLRPDVRALEHGQLDEAEQEKHRVEEQQRDRRRKGMEVQPRWFEKAAEDDWSYLGGYWEARAKDWKGVQVDSLW